MIYMGLNQIRSYCSSNWLKAQIGVNTKFHVINVKEIRSNGLFFGRIDLFSVEWCSVEWASVEWAVTWLNGVGLTLKRTGWPVYLVECKVYT